MNTRQEKALTEHDGGNASRDASLKPVRQGESWHGRLRKPTGTEEARNHRCLQSLGLPPTPDQALF